MHLSAGASGLFDTRSGERELFESGQVLLSGVLGSGKKAIVSREKRLGFEGGLVLTPHQKQKHQKKGLSYRLHVGAIAGGPLNSYLLTQKVRRVSAEDALTRRYATE